MGFKDRLRALLGLKAMGEDDWDELCDLLVEGDLGGALAERMVDELKARCAKAGVRDGQAARLELKALARGYVRAANVDPAPGGLNVCMLLGVNGVGKTTTAAKLARYWTGRGLVSGALLAAGDTFRAAAIDQLRHHGERLGLRVVAQEQGSDPGAVLYDALAAAKSEGAELVLADTAGRMHNKQHLVRELEKMDKIVAARVEPGRYKKLLVVDATTGQNALRQAEIFSEAVKVDALVLTKYDSSAKGGLALAIAKALNIGTAFVCDGEGYDAIRPFDPEAYLDEFIGLNA